MKLVLFDCDGTLVDSAATIHGTMRRTFLEFGKPEPSLEQTKAIIGLTLDIAIARIDGKDHADEEAVAMAAHYKSLFTDVRKDRSFNEPLFNGIGEVLERISREDHILIGAVTGKSRRGLSFILDLHGLSQHFIVRRTADDCPSKPHPAMVTECCVETGIAADRTIVIGDAIYDMQMARAAGAKPIGVSWGYGPVPELEKAGAAVIAHHPLDLIDLILQE